MCVTLDTDRCFCAYSEIFYTVLLPFSISGLSVWAAESLLLVCLAATSARLSHTHADASWLPWGYVIITSNQIPEGFNLDYVREVVTESCQEVNTVCLICLLQVCQRMVAHWGISAGNHIHSITMIDWNNKTNGYCFERGIILKMYVVLILDENLHLASTLCTNGTNFLMILHRNLPQIYPLSNLNYSKKTTCFLFLRLVNFLCRNCVSFINFEVTCFCAEIIFLVYDC